ncbi:MAG: phosphoribosylglycinamide formyltransferase [Bacteroidales bacterium]|nr:phosphoribosylglycinamide formyltransferase [Lentimicrobiaceae bacterium]MDD5693821.1 phosphoribosylglycinamide formyltransferase [Bacteroidales bacterium]
MKNIAIFASGSGTNAENIAAYFKGSPQVCIRLILTNKPDAYVVKRAEKFGIPTFVFNRRQFYQTEDVLNILKENRISLIVLAGFLWMVPDNILQAYPNRIINIHPALLPRYGGKGFYGSVVHEAVIRSGDTESGITIHYVNAVYDSGQIIFQARCPVEPGDTPESLAHRVHQLEYTYFPGVIEELLLD